MIHFTRFWAGLLALLLPFGGARGDEDTRKDYVLKVGDGIALRVFNEPDLDTDTRILKLAVAGGFATLAVSFGMLGPLTLPGLPEVSAFNNVACVGVAMALIRTDLHTKTIDITCSNEASCMSKFGHRYCSK